MKTSAFSLACALAALAAPAAAADAEALFASRICFACHSVTTGEVKRIGPYVVDIAAKYRGRSDAADYLKQKVLQGSAGVWGPAGTSVMPPNKVDEAEAKALVEWILSK